MNKAQILQQLVDFLAARIEGFERSARAAHAEATHEQNKAENKYDTRALEASYLAEGHARQAAEVLHALHQLETFELRNFRAGDAISVGALVELEGPDGASWYFLAPCEGGTELMCDGFNVVVLTPNSPLGEQVIGKMAGSRFKFHRGRTWIEFTIKSLL